MDQLTAYRILNLCPGCSIEEIKEAYAVLSKQYHPEEYPEQFQQIHEAYRFLMKMNRHSGRRQSPVNTGDSVLKRDAEDEEEKEETSVPRDFESVIKRSVRDKEAEAEPTLPYDFEAVLKRKAERDKRSYQFDGVLGQYEEYEVEDDIPDVNEVKRRLRKNLNRDTEAKHKKLRKKTGEGRHKRKETKENNTAPVKKRGYTLKERVAIPGVFAVCIVLLRICARLNSATRNMIWKGFSIVIAWGLGLFIVYLLLRKKFSNLAAQICISLILGISNFFILGSEVYASVIHVEAADNLSFLLFVIGTIWFLVLAVIAVCKGIRRIKNKIKRRKNNR